MKIKREHTKQHPRGAKRLPKFLFGVLVVAGITVGGAGVAQASPQAPGCGGGLGVCWSP